MSVFPRNPAAMGGPELHRIVCAWCARTDTSLRTLVDAADVSRSVFDKLPNRAYPRPSIGERLAATIAANPTGIRRMRAPTNHETDVGVAALEAARARMADAGVISVPKPTMSIAAQVAAEAAEAARRRHIARSLPTEPLTLIRSPSPAEAMATCAFKRRAS